MVGAPIEVILHPSPPRFVDRTTSGLYITLLSANHTDEVRWHRSCRIVDATKAPPPGEYVGIRCRSRAPAHKGTCYIGSDTKNLQHLKLFAKYAFFNHVTISAFWCYTGEPVAFHPTCFPYSGITGSI